MFISGLSFNFRYGILKNRLKKINEGAAYEPSPVKDITTDTPTEVVTITAITDRKESYDYHKGLA